MKNSILYIVFSVILFIYGALNYYIGLRGWQAVGSHITGLNATIYWLFFWLLAMSYLGARLIGKFLPTRIDQALTTIGAFWLAAMFYFVLILTVIDLIPLFDKWLGFLPAGIQNNPQTAPVVGLVILAIVTGLLVYGFWNARHPEVRHYDLTIQKQAGSLNRLHIVMVSDIHLGTIVHNGQLVKMTEMINKLQPDLVLFAGDIIDENIETFVEQKMTDSFRQLKPKLGTYAVFGNHEYIGGHAEEADRYLREAGVKVLRDHSVKVAGSFYVIGRDDRSGQRFTGVQRQKLAELMSGIDRSLPVILLDHQPVNLEEPEKQGVDLQLSGHTHRGQMFPNQFITGRIYEVDWGYLRKGNLQVIVSSGFGTWGPPIRVGNTPEIVDIVIHFNQ